MSDSFINIQAYTILMYRIRVLEERCGKDMFTQNSYSHIIMDKMALKLKQGS